MVLKSLVTALLVVAFTGCIGTPAADSVPPPPLDLRVERAQWETAPAGCEDVDRNDAKLAACDGEPTLGALVDGQGTVRCVDALWLLVAESTHLGSNVDPRAGDPSPQPNHPRPESRLSR